MIILGLLLLAAAAVGAVELILANGGGDPKIPVHMWGWTWHVDAFWLAVAGAAIMLVALVGLAMLKSSGRRARRLRRERKNLTAENRRLAKRANVAEATQAEPGGRAGAVPLRPWTAAPQPGARQQAPNGYVTPDGQDATGQAATERRG
jgi:hypothetical protein